MDGYVGSDLQKEGRRYQRAGRVRVRVRKCRGDRQLRICGAEWPGLVPDWASRRLYGLGA